MSVVRSRVSGYVVMEGAVGLVLSRYESDEPTVLTLGTKEATAFPTYSRARAAIRRTNRYAARHGLSWATQYSIVRLYEEAK